MTVELARHRDELAVRRDVDPVRALRLRDQVEQAFLHRLLHRDEVHVVDLLELTRGHQLLGLLPVGHVQEVGVLGGTACLERRAPALDAADVAFGAERVREAPAIGRALARVRQVLAVGRHLEGK